MIVLIDREETDPPVGEFDLAEQHADDCKPEPEPHAVDDCRNQRRQIHFRDHLTARGVKAAADAHEHGIDPAHRGRHRQRDRKERRKRTQRGFRRRPHTEEQNRNWEEHDLRRGRDPVEIRADRFAQPGSRADKDADENAAGGREHETDRDLGQ